MAKYGARFFFDAGSGRCLWANSDVTRTAFDYDVDIGELNISNDAKALADQVMRWYDTSLNWSSPADPLPEPWTMEEKRHFDDTARRLLAVLRTELGEDWEIIDEFQGIGRPLGLKNTA